MWKQEINDCYLTIISSVLFGLPFVQFASSRAFATGLNLMNKAERLNKSCCGETFLHLMILYYRYLHLACEIGELFMFHGCYDTVVEA